MDDLRERAVAILRRNDRGGYSVPTDGLYPFQWNWDSGFAAMGYGCFDEARAWRELARLLDGQWPDGMVPHIVFHREDPRYFPGPEVWGTARTPRTSGITQPPILAVCARRLLERARDQGGALAALRQLFPKLLAYHRWYHAARDPDGTGLVAALPPLGDGHGQQPRLGRAARARAGRSAAGLRAPRHRPRGCEPAPAPCRVRPLSDPGLPLSGARLRAAGALRRDPVSRLPTSASTASCIAPIGTCSRWRRSSASAAGTSSKAGSSAAAWRCKACGPRSDGGYRSRDQLTGEPLAVGTSASFLPLFAGAVPPERAPRLVATLERWAEQVRFLVPEHRSGEPAVRAAPLLARAGLADRELDDRGRARRLRSRRSGRSACARMPWSWSATSGFWEYFDPMTGEGLGGADFTWTAAATLFWLLGHPRRSNRSL